MRACQAINCKRNVPPHLFMCGRHWNALPSHLQRELCRNYQRGQENNASIITQAYWDAAKACQEYIRKKENP